MRRATDTERPPVRAGGPCGQRSARPSADRAQDLRLAAQEDQGDDRDDGDEREDQRVLGETLALLVPDGSSVARKDALKSAMWLPPR